MENKEIPSGVVVVCLFYLINAILFALTCILFGKYLNIQILGKLISGPAVVAVRALFIIVPLYLAIGLLYLSRELYALAIFYHLFFITNGAATIYYFLNKKLTAGPLLEITLKPDYSTNPIIELCRTTSSYAYIIQISGIIVGVTIISYLFAKRRFFSAV